MTAPGSDPDRDRVTQGPWADRQAPSPASAGGPGKRPGFRERFLHMLGRDDPPETVAASFALGVTISFTPLIGLHWIIALLLAVMLRLNKIDVLLGTLAVNPLTLGPVSAVAIPLGRILLRARREAVTHLPWHEVLRRSFWLQAGPTMRTIGLHWAVGMFVLSFVAGSLTYAILVRVLRARRLKEEATPNILP